jgi:TatD DNase family protein
MNDSKHRADSPLIDILPGMIDSHFHSEVMRQKGLDPVSLFEAFLSKGFTAGIDIGTRAGDTADRSWIHDRFDSISLAAGLFPAEAEEPDTEKRLDLLIADLDTYPVRAVGEIGLDFHWNYATPEKQQDLFIKQIEIADQFSLPIIVHNRKADILIEKAVRTHPPKAGGIMHCFSSTYEYAKRYIDLGFYISFAGNVTYKGSEDIREAAGKIPLDRLLVETDSPYLSPQKVRGRPNHPGHIGFVYREIASLRGVDVEGVVAAVNSNLYSLLKNGVFPDKSLQDK